jgi:hypothetical protein
MTNHSLANVVFVLHVLFVCFVVVTPFTEREELLTLHAFIIPFVCFHWFLANDACFLTLIEQRLRGVPSNKSFFHALMSPIYKPAEFNDPQLKQAVWVCTLVLWALSVRKLKKRKFAFVKEILASMHQLIPSPK